MSGISPMITSMKTTHGSVALKHRVALYINAKFSIGSVNMGERVSLPAYQVSLKESYWMKSCQ